MTKRILAAAAAATLLLAACGGDDDGGSAQDEVADLYIEAIGELAEELEVDLEVDESCVRDLAQQLSDDDAQKLLDAGIEGEPEGLSPEADEIGDQLLDCVSDI